MPQMMISELMEIGDLPNPYELKSEDVERPLDESFGDVLPADVGKLVYLRRGILQMESPEQKARRLLRVRSGC